MKSLMMLGVLLIFTMGLVISEHFVYGENANDNSTKVVITNDYIQIISNSEGNLHTLNLDKSTLLFDFVSNPDVNGNLLSYEIHLKPELSSLYKDLGYSEKERDTVFVYPSFTQSAYDKGGFYDYYNKKCDSSCLTIPIQDKISGFQSSSIVGAWVLKLLDYPYVKDQDIDKNPDILKKYKRVIVLHNEYVTKKEFDAITSHPNVIYLYPNALYAEVKANYDANTITLVRGHGYPDSTIKNGFQWLDDNSRYEYDVDCSDWYFYKTERNNTMLNCYPEYKLLSAEQLLRSLHDNDPSGLLNDLNNWLRYPNDQSIVTGMLNDFDVKGKHVPSWVKNPVSWALNNDISKTDFAHVIRYLYDQNLLN